MAKKSDPKRNMRSASDSLTNANKNMPWVKRYLEGNKLSIPDPLNIGSGKTSSHLLSYHPLSDSTAMIFPRLVQQDDSLMFMSEDQAREYATENKTGITTDLELAKYYSENGLIDHKNMKKYAKGGPIKDPQALPYGTKYKDRLFQNPKDSAVYSILSDGRFIKEPHPKSSRAGLRNPEKHLKTQQNKNARFDKITKNRLLDEYLHNKSFSPDAYRGRGLEELNSEFENMDLTEYGIGGWLEDNGGNVLKTALGAGLSFAGMPQVGLPMALSAGSDMLFGGDEVSQPRDPRVSKTSQMYQMPARGGMNLKKQPMRSDFSGNDHEQGGIPLSGIGVEVEDGEVRTGDTIHSENIKITPAMVARYGKRTGIKKGDRGKSVADIVKRADKKFEKREGDKWNDQARKIVQAGYEEMSNELADIYQIAQEMSVGMPQGNQMAEGGLDLGTLLESGDDLENMPMLMSAFGALSNFVTPPEKVNYQGADFAPTEVTPVRGNYDRIKRVYGNTRGRLNRLNPKGFQNNAAALASAEAESVGDMSSRVDEINAGNKNAAARQDSQIRSRTSMFNSQLSAKQAEANAANRGAKRSATEAYLSNFATQAGQKARDTKLYDAQDRRMGMMDDHLKGLREIRTGSDPDVYAMDNLWELQDNVNKEDLQTENWMSSLFNDSESDVTLEPWMQKRLVRRFGGRLKKHRK